MKTIFEKLKMVQTLDPINYENKDKKRKGA